MSQPGKMPDGQTPALLAKAALRRLAEQRLGTHARTLPITDCP